MGKKSVAMHAVIDGEDLKIGTCHPAKARILVKKNRARWKGARLYLADESEAEEVSEGGWSERALRRVLGDFPPGGITYTREFELGALDAFGKLDELGGGARAKHILIHPWGLRHFRGSPHFDPCTTSAEVDKGYEGHFWGAMVFSSDALPREAIIFTSQAYAEGREEAAGEVVVLRQRADCDCGTTWGCSECPPKVPVVVTPDPFNWYDSTFHALEQKGVKFALAYLTDDTRDNGYMFDLPNGGTATIPLFSLTVKGAPTAQSAVEAIARAVDGYVESLAPDRKYLLMALKHTEQDDGVFYVRLGFLASDYKPDNFHVTDWPFSEFRGDNARDVFLNALDGERKRPTMRDMMRDIARPLIPAGVLALVEEAKGLGINLVPDPLNQGAIPAYDCCGGYRLVEGGEWEQRDLVTCLVAHMFDGEELHLASDVLGSGELPSNAENLLWRLPYTLTDEGEVNIWGLVAVKGERSLVDAFCEQVDTARQDPDFVPLFKHHEPARVVAVDDEHVHVEINGVGGAYLAFWSVRHFPGGVPEVGTHLVLNTEMGMEASLHPILTSVRDTAEDRGEHLQDCIQVANRLMPCLEEHGVDVTAKATKWGEVYLSTEGPWLRGPEAWIQRTFVFEVWGTDLGIKVMMDTEKSEFDPSVAETLSREHVSQEWFKAATLDELVVELPRLFAYMRDPDQIGFAESQ